MSGIRAIKGYEGIYIISDEGKVYRVDKGYASEMKVSINKDGYPVLSLYRDNTSKQFRLHRLLAQAFIPNPDELPEVHHKDENKLNYRINNLEWCTRSKNMEYSFAKDYSLVSPDGEVVRFTNLNKFCRDNELNIGHVYRVMKGQRKTTKQWSAHVTS